MGSVMQGIFGGKKSTATQDQSNQAYGFLKDTFSPVTAQAGTGANALAALLGGDPTGFNAYKNATGFDAAAEAGSRGITNNAAASGLLRSGDTGKALENYGVGLQNQYANDYMTHLAQQAGLGLQAGQLIGSAGNVSHGQSKMSDKPGLFGSGSGGAGSFIGALL